jgi:hypothetical protein
MEKHIGTSQQELEKGVRHQKEEIEKNIYFCH